MRNETQESCITSVSSHSQERERRREHTEVSRSNTTPAQVKIIYSLRVERAAICGPLGYGGTTFPRIPLPHASRRVSAEGKICPRFRRRESAKSHYSLKVIVTCGGNPTQRCLPVHSGLPGLLLDVPLSSPGDKPWLQPQLLRVQRQPPCWDFFLLSPSFSYSLSWTSPRSRLPLPASTLPSAPQLRGAGLQILFPELISRTIMYGLTLQQLTFP